MGIEIVYNQPYADLKATAENMPVCTVQFSGIAI